MIFCPIVPQVLLTSMTLGRRVHFALAQHYRFEEYREWMKRARQQAQTLILDNGQYEGEMLGFAQLAEAINLFTPNVAVLPDVLGDAKMTKYLSENFVDYYEQKLRGWHPEWMRVLQSITMSDLVREYAELPYYKWIGFPRRLRDKRLALAELLQVEGLWRPDVNHHALGMYDGDQVEYYKLACCGFYSGDSSNPVWRRLESFQNFDPFWNKIIDPLTFKACRAKIKEMDLVCQIND